MSVGVGGVGGRTTVRSLAAALDMAERDGLYIGYHHDRVVTILDGETVARKGPPITVDAIGRRKAELLHRRWPNSYIFEASTGDKASRDAGLAPFTIYPLPVETRARLACDLTVISSAITFEALATALQRRGATINLIIGSSQPTSRGPDAIEIGYSGRGLRIPLGGINQLLLEFTDTRRWAEAVWELFDHNDVERLVPTFTNERAEWD